MAQQKCLSTHRGLFDRLHPIGGFTSSALFDNRSDSYPDERKMMLNAERYRVTAELLPETGTTYRNPDVLKSLT